VFDLMTKWIERYRQQAQERYERLDVVLAEMRGDRQPIWTRTNDGNVAHFLAPSSPMLKWTWRFRAGPARQ
jgi:hypothetical protein